MSEPSPLSQPDIVAWHPYMCPTCRGLFRAPEDEEAVKCPLCKTITLIAPIENDRLTSIPVQPKGERQRQKVTRKVPAANKSELGWDAVTQDEQKRHERLERFVWASSLILLTVIVFLFVGFIIRDHLKPKPPVKFDANIAELKESTAEAQRADSSFQNYKKLDMEGQALETINRFLTAPSIDAYPSLIRFPEQVMPLIKRHHEKFPYVAPGKSKSYVTGTQISNNLVSTNVLLPDHSIKAIALEILDDGSLLVDWESWAAYCERPWEDFLEQKVTEETLVRVIVSYSNYYNFQFDDQNWRAYRLDRSNDEPVAYGYLPIDSPLHLKLPSLIRNGGTFILKVRFPDFEAGPDQVIITDVVAYGWVFPSEHYQATSAPTTQPNTK